MLLLDLPNAFKERVWPQVFVTRVLGSDDLPDVEILTLPSYESKDAIVSLEALAELLHTRQVEQFNMIGGSSVDHDERACFAALHQVILDAHIREDMLPWNPQQTEQYAETIYAAYPLPIMNSPLTGSSLMQLVTAAGSSAAFMAAFPHDLGHITLYFVVVGGTRIVLGAADGISIGLKQGLSHVILRWMGVPTNTANPTKRKAKSSKDEAGSAP